MRDNSLCYKRAHIELISNKRVAALWEVSH